MYVRVYFTDNTTHEVQVLDHHMVNPVDCWERIRIAESMARAKYPHLVTNGGQPLQCGHEGNCPVLFDVGGNAI